MADISSRTTDLRALCATLLREIVREDRKFLAVGFVYAIVISLLTLAVPVSVQLLVGSIVNTASADAVNYLTAVLFAILLLSSAMIAAQSYVMEKFERHFYARIVSEFTLKLIYADRKFFKSINRYELVNRYFDVTQVQKILPTMVVGLFTTILQAIVGCLVVASFHQSLLVFVFVFVLLVWLGWRLWGYRAMYSAIKLSEAKYETGRHLEDVAKANDYYKSGKHSIYAMDRSNDLTRDYIDARKIHFRQVFSQQIWLLVVYVLANAGLLGIGGNLVISGSLGLGQLIAAELILSGVFYGAYRISYHLANLYKLVAALEEIFRVIDIPTEVSSGDHELEPYKPVGIEFRNVGVVCAHHTQRFNFAINPGDKVLIRSDSYELQSALFDIMKRYIEPCQGQVLIDGRYIQDYKQRQLRDQIIILDRTTTIEAKIIDFLRVDSPAATFTEIKTVLELVELDHVIEDLPDKEDTMLSIDGLPLTVSETLRLKLAYAILARPRILVINEFYDLISVERCGRILQRMCGIPNMTLMYFSQQLSAGCFSRYFVMDEQGQYEVESLDELHFHAEGEQDGNGGNA